MADDFIRPHPHQHIAVHAMYVNHIVGYQPVSHVNQFQGGLAFPNPRIPKDQYPQTKDFYQHPVNALAGRKNLGKGAHQPCGKVRGSQIGYQNGTIRRFRNLKKSLVRAIIMGKNAAGNWIFKQFLYIAKIALIFQLPQIGHLPPAEKVYPLEGKILKKAHNCPHWPVKVRNTDLPAKPLSAPYAAKVERIMLLEVNIYQIQNGKMRIRHGIYCRENAQIMQYNCGRIPA
jgi:hypothetical protein